MLIRAFIANHLSIYAEQEFSLVATALKGPTSVLRDAPHSPTIKLLPAAVMYGANASGKTNFIRGLQFMRTAVLRSHAHGDPQGGVPRVPFGLADEAESEPSRFAIDFVVDGKRYEYGFAADQHQFLTEWLLSYPEGKRRLIFSRDKQHVKFGQTMRGPKKIIEEIMRPNSLFISAATQNDHPELSSISSFFRNIEFVSRISVSDSTLNTTFEGAEIDARVIPFLHSVGVGVTNIRQKEVDIPENLRGLMTDVANLMRQRLGETAGFDLDGHDRGKRLEIELCHVGKNGKTVFLPLESESSGTRRLLFLMDSVFRSIDNGSLIVIDELDASLHTKATELILSIFCDKNINKNGAQIIATTHDTNLLNADFLRRDQIWFVERDMIGGSHVYPLAEIKSRSTDDFQRGYLEGRFGAIPFAGDIYNLIANLAR